MKPGFLLIIIYASILILLSVVPVVGQGDSLRVLAFEKFMNIVKSHHPVAMQASLTMDEGAANLLNARGGFDPKAFTRISQKYFDDKQYYSLADAGLKIPTWFGLELQAGYEQNQGNYLNPENNTPGAGLYYAGISLPIGQGLFIDKRRAELRKAQTYMQITALEQQLMLNNLLYDAGKAYWDWFMSYAVIQVYEDALQLAQTRFDAVKQGSTLGDRPNIDTLEAGIQVQNRLLNLQQAELEYRNSTAFLSVFLWEDGFIPLEPEDGTVPLSIDLVTAMSLESNLPYQLDSLINNHPILKQYEFKVEQLEIERRWKREQLKPVLNLKYNAISEPIGGNPFTAYNINNYTWGLEFSFPILLRKERGDIQLADIKIQQANYDIQSKQAMLTFKANSAINEWYTTIDQIFLYNQTVRDYGSLLAGERRMFEAGESSLFMVNSRELGYINAQIKLIELLAKNQKAGLNTDFSLGQLADMYN